MEFADKGGKDWGDDIKIFHLWQLKPLYIKLTPVQR
jgi:hypothetical protein